MEGRTKKESIFDSLTGPSTRIQSTKNIVLRLPRMNGSVTSQFHLLLATWGVLFIAYLAVTIANAYRVTPEPIHSDVILGMMMAAWGVVMGLFRGMLPDEKVDTSNRGSSSSSDGVDTEQKSR